MHILPIVVTRVRIDYDYTTKCGNMSKLSLFHEFHSVNNRYEVYTKCLYATFLFDRLHCVRLSQKCYPAVTFGFIYDRHKRIHARFQFSDKTNLPLRSFFFYICVFVISPQVLTITSVTTSVVIKMLLPGLGSSALMTLFYRASHLAYRYIKFHPIAFC